MSQKEEEVDLEWEGMTATIARRPTLSWRGFDAEYRSLGALPRNT